jgi:putative colanic acid biosynthesis acetyltransferase WcaF
MTGLAATHFPLRHRLFRAVWSLTWLLLAAWTPPPLHPWRSMLLRLFGAKIGRNVRVYGTANIWYPPNLTLGDDAVIGWRSVIYCQAPIHIGEGAIVSQYAHLISGSHDVDEPSLPLLLSPIEIGPGAWVCAGAMVGPGVTLGPGAVLGAGGVAFSDLPDWTIHVGNPARYLRHRRRGATSFTSPWPRARPQTPLRLRHSPHH